MKNKTIPKNHAGAQAVADQPVRNRVYKALMLDLDGTVLNSYVDQRALPTRRVTDAIKQAQQHVHVGIATGRTMIEAAPILDHLGLHGPSVIQGGAQVIDAHTRKILWERRLEAAVVRTVYQTITKLGQQIGVNDEETNANIMLSDDFIPKQPLSLWNHSLDEHVADMLIDKLSDISSISVYKVPALESKKWSVLVYHLEATKQHGIFEVARRCRLQTHDFIGVGDSDNDFPLLMASGLKIAMGNAGRELKAIADFVAPPVTEDGVAKIIETFILNQAAQ